jgi:hypothetical protein
MGQGLNKDVLARFAAVAASHAGDDEVPGLVALVVAHRDEPHAEAIGNPAGDRSNEARCSGSRRR